MLSAHKGKLLLKLFENEKKQHSHLLLPTGDNEVVPYEVISSGVDGVEKDDLIYASPLAVLSVTVHGEDFSIADEKNILLIDKYEGNE